MIFNYKKIEPIRIGEIKTVVIDQGVLLKKIITADREVCISNEKLLKKDAEKFIDLLSSIIEQNEGRIINSWEVWEEKGYLKWVLRINRAIIIVIVAGIIIFGLVIGFDKVPPASFFILLFLLPQMLLFKSPKKK